MLEKVKEDVHYWWYLACSKAQDICMGYQIARGTWRGVLCPADEEGKTTNKIHVIGLVIEEGDPSFEVWRSGSLLVRIGGTWCTF
jgi:hypothetical protein